MGISVHQVNKRSIKNNQSLLNFVDEYNLNIMNLDIKCKGEITWQQGNMGSVQTLHCVMQQGNMGSVQTLQYVMQQGNMGSVQTLQYVIKKLYETFLDMYIDDEWEILKIADHNLIKILFFSIKAKNLRTKL